MKALAGIFGMPLNALDLAWQQMDLKLTYELLAGNPFDYDVNRHARSAIAADLEDARSGQYPIRPLAYNCKLDPFAVEISWMSFIGNKPKFTFVQHKYSPQTRNASIGPACAMSAV